MINKIFKKSKYYTKLPLILFQNLSSLGNLYFYYLLNGKSDTVLQRRIEKKLFLKTMSNSEKKKDAKQWHCFWDCRLGNGAKSDGM